LGGAGDDTVVVENSRGILSSFDSYLLGSDQKVMATGSIDQVNFRTSNFTLNGGSIGTDMTGQVLQDDGATLGAGTRAVWIGFWDGAYTKAVRVVFSNMADGGVSARVVGSGYVGRNVVGQSFNWNTERSPGAIATQTTSMGYGMARMVLLGNSPAQTKQIDGGDGTDTVDYSNYEVLRGAGIEADLSNKASQTVKTWRNADGTINAASVTDSLKNIENLGGTGGNDKITGSDADNRLWGYDGDDLIDGGAGNDVIITGLGQDTVLGGAGDDTVVVENSRGVLSSFDSYLLGSDQKVMATGSIDQVNFRTSNFTLNGGSIGTDMTGQVLQDDGAALGAGTRAVWIGYWDGAYTKAVRVLFSNMADGGVSARVVGSGYVDRNVLGQSFNWNTERSPGAIATQTSSMGYGVARMMLLGNAPAQPKQIDGGDGNDTVNYNNYEVMRGAGIEADLSNKASQTVKTWRNADGTINAASATDSLTNVENLGGTGGNDKITGSDADNRLWGYDGDDLIDGGAGNDVIITGGGQDTVNGGSGNDGIFVDQEPAALSGRYVLVRHLGGVSRSLALTELRVWSGGVNVALNASVRTSADGHSGTYSSSRLVDGQDAAVLDGAYISNAGDGSSWVMVDLGKEQVIDRIDVSALTSALYGSMGSDIGIYVASSDPSGNALSDADLKSIKNIRYAELSGRNFNGVSGLLSQDGKLSFGAERFIRSKDIDGGAGEDFVSYRQTQGAKGVGIHASLATGQVNTWYEAGVAKEGAAVDKLANVENLGGTDVNDLIEGNAEANKLVGYDGDDILSGGGGNDQLAGGLGSDTYLLAAGWGSDVIFEDDDTSAHSDRVVFDAGVGYQNLWMSRQGDALVVGRLGSSDALFLQDWYASAPKTQIEQIRAGNYAITGVQNINAFVSALAQFGSAPSSLETFSAATQARVFTEMSRSWLSTPV
jgi:Ca2+-binding RTX toxin-like protein